MQKRLAVTGIAIAACLVLLLSSMACAWFTDTATATITGKTGLVKISTWNVKISPRFQPGDTQYAWLKVHNAGNCPIKIEKIVIIGKPSFLGVSVSGPVGQTFKPCKCLYFKLYVKMPEGVTKPQDQFFSFKIRFYARNVPTAWPTVPKT